MINGSGSESKADKKLQTVRNTSIGESELCEWEKLYITRAGHRLATLQELSFLEKATELGLGRLYVVEFISKIEGGIL